MLDVGTTMFLLIAGESKQKILHRGKVVHSDEQVFICEFQEHIWPDVGADVNAYCEVRGKFYQQGAKVMAQVQAAPCPILAFRRVGEPVSAEQRETYRVSLVTADIKATVGDEQRCAVVDVSPVGLAVVTAREYPVGGLIEVTITCEDETLKGEARVQTVRTRPDGKFRHGLLAMRENVKMRQGLERLTATMQRMQLRRLARVA